MQHQKININLSGELTARDLVYNVTFILYLLSIERRGSASRCCQHLEVTVSRCSTLCKRLLKFSFSPFQGEAER